MKRTLAGYHKRELDKELVRIGMLSLGCPKSLVDSECILGKLDPQRYVIAPSVTDCDVAIMNTCSFIQDARDESFYYMSELIRLKKEGNIRAIIVVGCLVQQVKMKLKKDWDRIDAFVGSGEYREIPRIVQLVLKKESIFRVGKPGYLGDAQENRVPLTPKHFRYLKISEGCNHHCSFCSIPIFRGRYQSRPEKDILAEARRLVDEGAKEIILIGQDTTSYGKDISKKWMLPKLIRKLDRIEGIEWIRILYAYPSNVTEELMRAIRDSEKVCHYFDLPLQHISDRILKLMKRGASRKRMETLIKTFRRIVPDLAIRTAFIVGFPGETEKDFKELLDFVRMMCFDRLGVFMYSPEVGTGAYRLRPKVSEQLKIERFHRLMALQQKVSISNNRRFLGQSLRVLVDDQDETEDRWVARSWMDAPEVDGNVYIETKKRLEIGSFYNVRITSIKEYDLMGKL